jgi:hypothetical protein
MPLILVLAVVAVAELLLATQVRLADQRSWVCITLLLVVAMQLLAGVRRTRAALLDRQLLMVLLILVALGRQQTRVMAGLRLTAVAVLLAAMVLLA